MGTGGGGGGGKDIKQSTEVSVPEWAQPYSQDVLANYGHFLNKPYQQYSGQRIAPFTQNQNTGLDLTSQYAQNNPITDAATKLSADTLSGKYLGQENPAWAPMAARIRDQYQQGTAAQTDAAFSRAGAYGLGNSAYADQVSSNQRDYGDALSGLAGNLYNSERDRQMATLGMAPQTSAANYANYQALIGTGDAQRQYQQDVINQNYADWYNKQMYPQTRAREFASIFPGLLGNAGTTTSQGPNPNQVSPIAASLGGGLAGYALGAEIGGQTYGPYGAAIGALAGYGLSRYG